MFARSLEGLKAAGVNVRDPVQLLYVLKRLGPEIFEEMFGAGESDEAYPRGRIPLVPTDVFEMSRACIESNRPTFQQPKVQRILTGHRILIASTDVHEHAILVISQLLSEAGLEMINLEVEKNPDEVVLAACDNEVDAILISTHNGMALEYAQRLKEEFRNHKAVIPVLMGGVLNQKNEDRALPIDVTENIKELGFYAYARLEGTFSRMLGYQVCAKNRPSGKNGADK